MSEAKQPENEVTAAERALINEDWQDALDLFDKALEQQPANHERAEILNGRGVALLQLGNPDEAIASLQEALKLEPGMASAYYNMALCYEAQDDYQKALAAYNKAIQAEPGDAEAYFRRGGIYFQLEDFAATVSDATKAIELHEGEAVTGPYIARGLALHQLERYEEALDDYSKALEADPRSAADAYFYRALVHLDRDEAMPARADFQAFLLMTDDPDGLLGTQAREIIEELDKME